jgi:hypothetical protein
MSNFVVDPPDVATRAAHRFGPSMASPPRHALDRRRWWTALLCAFVAALTCGVHAQDAGSDVAPAAEPQSCLPDGSGYLRARLKGAIDAELDWTNDHVDCTGAVRPTDGGLRVRFTGEIGGADGAPPQRLVLVFGIAGLREGASARTVPVNVTVIREGTGEFYGTRGDDKCTLDQVTQAPLVGIPHRARVYRIEVRGFCSEPARAVTGPGSLLISRFDFAGRIDFSAQDAEQEPATPTRDPHSHTT